MKALIGLDRYSDPSPILDLFGRIGFADCSAVVANVLDTTFPMIEPILATAGGIHPVLSTTTLTQTFPILRRQAERLLSEARETLYDQGIHCETEILYGLPAEALIRKADDASIDLVCAASHTTGPLRAAIMGSVCRGLTIGAKQSVLIAKRAPDHDRPFSAVLATDHSDFCDQAVSQLLAMNPMGVQKLTILTSIAPAKGERLSEKYDLPESEPKLDRLEADVVWQRNEEIASKFQRLSIKTDVVVVETPIRQAIDNVIAEHQAELLILAAQGHGFFERLTIGSLSLHEAVAENHSLLILRPKGRV